jgi:hypothetical protein
MVDMRVLLQSMASDDDNRVARAAQVGWRPGGAQPGWTTNATSSM